MKEEIERALAVLKEGGTILYPTDTIWGIGCDATREDAVQKIFSIKGRDAGKSLIVLLDQAARLNKYLKEVPAVAWDLIEVSEKPLTIVYDDPQYLAPSVINTEDNSVGIRITRDEFCCQLIYKLNKPLISTSANLSGFPSPANFSEINEELLRSVDYVVNLRRHEKSHGTPSAILKINKKSEVKVLRK